MRYENDRPGCGCGRPRPRPKPPSCDPPRPETNGPCPGGFFMQRILACGRLHRRRKCVALSLCSLPADALPPFTVLEVNVCGAPRWMEGCGCGRGGMALQVTVPLALRLRDSAGRVYRCNDEIEEELPLRFDCPPNECWRGIPTVQAAVRLAGHACPCGGEMCEIPLEIYIEGFLLLPCALGRQENPCRPAPLPWYPQPLLNPYQD